MELPKAYVRQYFLRIGAFRFALLWCLPRLVPCFGTAPLRLRESGCKCYRDASHDAGHPNMTRTVVGMVYLVFVAALIIQARTHTHTQTTIFTWQVSLLYELWVTVAVLVCAVLLVVFWVHNTSVTAAARESAMAEYYRGRGRREAGEPGTPCRY